MSVKVAKIAVSKATYWIDRPYDYLVPDEMRQYVRPGVRVRVPFSRGNKLCEGIILDVSDGSDYPDLKYIAELIDREPVMSEAQLKLALFMRDRFFCTVFEAVRAILPSGFWFNKEGKRRINDAFVEIASLNISSEEAFSLSQSMSRKSPKQAAILEILSGFVSMPLRDLLLYSDASRQSFNALSDRELVTISHKEIYRIPKQTEENYSSLPVLNSEQQAVFENLSEQIFRGEPAVSLLYGITGSGKTSVYARLIDECLSSEKDAILLVPEISLTPQTISVFRSYFSDKVAVLHSGLADSERYDEWMRIKRGEAKVVIGTRSAVFAPVNNLGIIIIDEEQEQTYKSENAPRYNARGIARFRCWEEKAPLLLGSATPDIVSMYNSRNSVYSLYSLKNRYNESGLPEVSVVDMRKELIEGNGSDISTVLYGELKKNIENGEQSILFINRRGTYKQVVCSSCGYTYSCPKCSVSLTYHGKGNRMICHYCGYSCKVGESCPDCGGRLIFLGTGTQKVVDELNGLFPDVEVLRMDADSLSEYGSHDSLFNEFLSRKIPILVGTQMVSKGLNFNNVTLVGVINADHSLYSGNYRASEETFSLLTQVIGRSGRGEKTGRAVIQTFTPDNPVIRFAAAQDYDSFYDYELPFRQIQNMPPFSDLFRIVVIGTEENKALNCAKEIADSLRKNKGGFENLTVFGPSALPVAKVNNRFRFAVGISCRNSAALRRKISETIIACNKDKRFRELYIFGDYNPV